ncbi:MAG: DegT/DnrJ/EryC1/StrS family aminotransferase [Prolixibacteraceae bacterium]|jgi:perosamine synthetase|nr:DegT/DnrJ/EryC1/StrS family aminotransferase [Prolixibacteraceae bacterium]MBT6007623.1 DegT/DnrJ/EryC1/StrS family aminotransferase [Prolixibacteraceae bacterium]MBT6764838.1 DegT/DnrJ/EryC1/StrS family aminotransferase [Prolixibacteraceae bacterium]MBT6998089.1 DegT/DnrJ/EryC1/StrS family aminotransferase [Prolixibacteraceae bacterium]MBT7394637.1 DegT/DnrJ/EryC1/StrS family aminotransferase [Prolixibacteraceae bacterium]
MKKKLSTRRTFVKKTTIGAAGVALTTSGMSSVFAGVFQDSEKLALLGGIPVRPKGSTLEANWPIYDESDIQMYLDAYKSNWSEHSLDPEEFGQQFQKKYAELMGVNYCVITNAGTNSLEAAQRALDIGPGDEVITQTNTYVATAQSTFNLFALPVLVDSDPETFMINPDLIEEHITPNTKAILPVHIGGAAADMDKIMAIAKKHNLAVIEDVCQAHMGEWRNKKLGTIGDLGCFSFQQFKSLAAGEGGAVIGDDENLMTRIGGYVNNGRDPQQMGRTFPGTNFRPSAFQAANALSQVRRLEDQSTLRDENASHLEKLLSEIKGVRPTKKYAGQTRRAYYSYQLIYEKEHFKGLPKAKFREAMNAEGIDFGKGIDSNLHTDPFVETYLNLRSIKKVYSKERLEKYRNEIHCPVNEHIGKETGLSLGQRVFLGTKKDMEDIVTAIVKIQKNASKLL